MSADALDDAQLAAYLAGDADELTARRIEARLAEDPELGERLDRIHGALLAMRRPDAVEAPSGLSERLMERLEGEVGAGTGAGAGTAAAAGTEAAAAGAGAAAAGTDAGASARAALPEGRGEGAAPARGGWPWTRHLGTVAAAVVALALLGGLFFVAPPGGEEEADRAASTADDADAPGVDGEGESGQEAAPMESEGADESMPEQRALELDDEAAGDDDAVEEDAGPADDGGAGDAGAGDPLPRWPSDRPIAREEAEGLADERWRDMTSGEAACREEVEAAADRLAVPVDVRPSGSRPDALVYELVTAVGSRGDLDRGAWVTVDPDGCDVLEIEVDD